MKFLLSGGWSTRGTRYTGNTLANLALEGNAEPTDYGHPQDETDEQDFSF